MLTAALLAGLTTLALQGPFGGADAASATGAGPFAPLHPAPAGTWSTAGGSPARTRAAVGRAPLGRPGRAWNHRPDGALVGEPRVEHDAVLVEQRTSDGRRALVLLDRRSGLPRGPAATFEPGPSLAPALARGVVVVRAAPDRLSAYRIGRAGLAPFWTLPVDGPLGPPLLVGERVVVTAGRSVVAVDLGHDGPAWTRAGVYPGPLAVAPPADPGGAAEVFALRAFRQFDGGSLRLDRLSLEDGSVLDERWIAPLAPEAGRLERAGLGLLDDGAALWFEGRLPLDGDGGTRSVAALGLARPAPEDGFELALPFLAAPPLPLGAGALLAAELEDGGAEWVLERDLATGDGLVLGPARPGEVAAASASAGLVFVDGHALAPRGPEVRWSLPARGPWIPVDDGVLALGSDGAGLEAWLAWSDAVDPPIAFEALDAPGWTLERGTVVTVDGEPLLGRWTLADAATLRRARGRSGETLPLARVALIVAERRLVWAAGAAALLDGLDALAEHERRERARALAEGAASTRDAELLAALLRAGGRLGLEPGTLAALRADLARLRAEGRPVRSEAASAARAELAALAHLVQDERAAWLAELASAPPPDGRGAELELALLERMFQSDPRAPAALARLAERLPAGAVLGGAGSDGSGSDRSVSGGRPPDDGPDAVAWLELLGLAWRLGADWTPAEGGERGDGGAAPGAEPHPSRTRAPRLALATARVRITAPADRPDLFAAALPRAERLVRALAERADRGASAPGGGDSGSGVPAQDVPGPGAGGAAPSGPGRPLRIELFAERDAFTAVAGAPGPHGASAWDAALHDAAGDRTLALLPARDTVGAGEALDALVHALVHHWVERRRAPGAPLPPPWALEGLAGWAETLGLGDAVYEGWDAPRLARRNAVLASLEPGELLDWERVVGADAEELARLVGARPVERRTALDLGRLTRVDDLARHHAQATALVAHLLAVDEGRRRAALFELLLGSPAEGREAPDFAARFGASAAELGAAALLAARTRVADLRGD